MNGQFTKTSIVKMLMNFYKVPESVLVSERGFSKNCSIRVQKGKVYVTTNNFEKWTDVFLIKNYGLRLEETRRPKGSKNEPLFLPEFL